MRSGRITALALQDAPTGRSELKQGEGEGVSELDRLRAENKQLKLPRPGSLGALKRS